MSLYVTWYAEKSVALLVLTAPWFVGLKENMAAAFAGGDQVEDAVWGASGSAQNAGTKMAWWKSAVVAREGWRAAPGSCQCPAAVSKWLSAFHKWQQGHAECCTYICSPRTWTGTGEQTTSWGACVIFILFLSASIFCECCILFSSFIVWSMKAKLSKFMW